MLKIRLQRVGRKHEPVFRIVVTDSLTSAKKNRRFLVNVGSIDMRAKGTVSLDADRIKEFMKNGAQPSATVHNLLIEKGVMEGKKINVLSKNANKKPAEEVKAEAPKAEEKQEEAAPEAPAEEAPAEEAAPEAPAETPAEEKTEA
jgi:small subunit ribosomal protein S16